MHFPIVLLVYLFNLQMYGMEPAIEEGNPSNPIV